MKLCLIHSEDLFQATKYHFLFMIFTIWSWTILFLLLVICHFYIQIHSLSYSSLVSALESWLMWTRYPSALISGFLLGSASESLTGDETKDRDCGWGIYSLALSLKHQPSLVASLNRRSLLLSRFPSPHDFLLLCPKTCPFPYFADLEGGRVLGLLALVLLLFLNTSLISHHIL